MGAGHGHDHLNESTKRSTLLLVLGLTSTFMGVEAIAGWVTGSLALLVDAGHIEGRSHRVGLTPGSSPTDNRRVVEWLVEAETGTTAKVTVRSDRGGTLSGTVTFA